MERREGGGEEAGKGEGGRGREERKRREKERGKLHHIIGPWSFVYKNREMNFHR